ncbi:hypothetical protein FR932_00995 [Moritella marina ATCC 15381]|uniref:Uncharacterized protein n=1 Tax=Moritella marina ATCC 15381 TaxID=1202962 RepID=A0A5J6WF48_MORMI|nr:hypothetical protein [Moritella marina]QFI36499.1 hypothetical protein FR932_00995 [Moritella marina ATCC 15381]
MQLLKIIVMMTVLLPILWPAVAKANNCAIVVKLESAYLQNKTIYLDETLSQPVVDHQLCLSSDIAHNTGPYYLELFSEQGINLDALLIFPEYIQRDVVLITTADLLINFCRQCNDLEYYEQFINSTSVQAVATKMDAIIAKRPQAIMLDVIKQQFQQTLLNLYKLDIVPQQVIEPEVDNQPVDTDLKKADLNNADAQHVAVKEVDGDEQHRLQQLQKQGFSVQLPHHFLPVYQGAELKNFIPEGLDLNRVASLPLASYSVDASARTVLDFYQSLYPDYARIKFGNFVVLVEDKQPFEGYSPEYMAIPHIVISADPLGHGNTILQIIYRPDTTGIKGSRVMTFKPVT